MEIIIFIGLGLLFLFIVSRMLLRKHKNISPESATLISPTIFGKLKAKSATSDVPNRVLIGSHAASPLVTIEAVPGIHDVEKAMQLNTEDDKSISRLSALCLAVPSLLVTVEASGKRWMEVVIHGDLVRAADGNGLRAFAMNGKGISEHARLFEAKNLQHVINAAAVWQIASVVVAQKHLADISQKLDEIKTGIQHISQFLANQRKSRILATYDYLGQVYLSIKGGDLPISSRINLENCERDLLEIQHHLEMEYDQKVKEQVKHTETFGTEDLTNDIGKKIEELEELTRDMSLCLKTRMVAWYVLSLFPGDPQLKLARRASIQKSIDSLSTLAPRLETNIKKEIDGVKSYVNLTSTLELRKRTLEEKCMMTVKSLENTAEQLSKDTHHSEHLLLEHDRPTRLYLQIEGGELLEVRQAA